MKVSVASRKRPQGHRSAAAKRRDQTWAGVGVLVNKSPEHRAVGMDSGAGLRASDF